MFRCASNIVNSVASDNCVDGKIHYQFCELWVLKYISMQINQLSDRSNILVSTNNNDMEITQILVICS